jgi:hypothetical protein
MKSILLLVLMAIVSVNGSLVKTSYCRMMAGTPFFVSYNLEELCLALVRVFPGDQVSF